MGAGILGVPLFYKSYGLILSTILILLFATVTVYSVYQLIYCNRITKHSGYSIFAKICFGNIGNLMIKIVIIINNFGLCCAYFRIFGDVSKGVVKGFVGASPPGETNFFVDNWQNFFYVLIAGFLMSFFIFKERMDAVKVIF